MLFELSRPDWTRAKTLSDAHGSVSGQLAGLLKTASWP